MQNFSKELKMRNKISAFLMFFIIEYIPFQYFQITHIILEYHIFLLLKFYFQSFQKLHFYYDGDERQSNMPQRNNSTVYLQIMLDICTLRLCLCDLARKSLIKSQAKPPVDSHENFSHYDKMYSYIELDNLQIKHKNIQG